MAEHKDNFWNGIFKRQEALEALEAEPQIKQGIPVLMFDPQTFDDVDELFEEPKKETSMALDKQSNELKTENKTIDVPIAIGNDYVVIIKGLPELPSVAACERICAILMAYAVYPKPLANQPTEAVETK